MLLFAEFIEGIDDYSADLIVDLGLLLAQGVFGIGVVGLHELMVHLFDFLEICVRRNSQDLSVR